MAAIDLLHLAVDISKKCLLLLEIFLGMLHHLADDQHGYRQDQYCQNGHQDTDPKHHDKDPDERGDGSDQLRHTLVQALLQRVNIIRYTGKHFSCGTAFEIFHGHPVDLLRNILSETVAHIIGDSGHDKALDKVQAGTQKIETPQKYKDLTDLSKINASRSIDLFHQSLEDFRGGITEDRRSPDGKYGAGNCKDQHQKETDFVALHIIQQLFHAAGKILCFFIGHSSSAHAASVITHDLIPPLKAEMPRSDGKLRRILTVLYGCRCRRSVLHPEQ